MVGASSPHFGTTTHTLSTLRSLSPTSLADKSNKPKDWDVLLASAAALRSTSPEQARADRLEETLETDWRPDLADAKVPRLD